MIKTITAPDGKFLTQAWEVNPSERIMIREVSGFGDLESLYREASPEEYQEWYENNKDRGQVD